MGSASLLLSQTPPHFAIFRASLSCGHANHIRTVGRHDGKELLRHIWLHQFEIVPLDDARKSCHSRAQREQGRGLRPSDMKPRCAAAHCPAMGGGHHVRLALRALRLLWRRMARIPLRFSQGSKGSAPLRVAGHTGPNGLERRAWEPCTGIIWNGNSAAARCFGNICSHDHDARCHVNRPPVKTSDFSLPQSAEHSNNHARKNRKMTSFLKRAAWSSGVRIPICRGLVLEPTGVLCRIPW